MSALMTFFMGVLASRETAFISTIGALSVLFIFLSGICWKTPSHTPLPKRLVLTSTASRSANTPLSILLYRLLQLMIPAPVYQLQDSAVAQAQKWIDFIKPRASPQHLFHSLHQFTVPSTMNHLDDYQSPKARLSSVLPVSDLIFRELVSASLDHALQSLYSSNLPEKCILSWVTYVFLTI
jgi:hypothetical protein